MAGALAATAAPAYAAGPGKILCSMDICIQTASSSSKTAKIHAWANTISFYGYFNMYNSNGPIASDSPTTVWLAGGTYYTFTVPCHTNWTYYVNATDGHNGDNVGTVKFAIHSC